MTIVKRGGLISMHTCSPLRTRGISMLQVWLQQGSPTFLVPGTGFMQDNFSTGWGWGAWFWDDSSTLNLWCTVFQILGPRAWGLLLWQDYGAVLQQVFSTLAAHWTHLRNFKILMLRSHPLTLKILI